MPSASFLVGTRLVPMLAGESSEKYHSRTKKSIFCTPIPSFLTRLRTTNEIFKLLRANQLLQLVNFLTHCHQNF